MAKENQEDWVQFEAERTRTVGPAVVLCGDSSGGSMHLLRFNVSLAVEYRLTVGSAYTVFFNRAQRQIKFVPAKVGAPATVTLNKGSVSTRGTSVYVSLKGLCRRFNVRVDKTVTLEHQQAEDKSLLLTLPEEGVVIGDDIREYDA